MTCQTRSASTHAETPAAETPEPAEAPSTPKVDQSPSTAHPSTIQPSTAQQSSTSQPSTTPPTDSPLQTDVLPEPMSQSRAMKRPLEQVPQPELKRMSLGDDPSLEHGVLAAEDLRWLPRQRPREVRCLPTCWNPDTAQGRGPVLTPCTQDEVVEVAFTLSLMRSRNSSGSPGSSGTTRTRRGASKHADSAGTRRVYQSEAKGNQQFPQTCSGGCSYEVWIAMQKLDADALCHHEETRLLTEGSLGDTGVHGPTAGSNAYRLAHGLHERKTAVSDGGRVFELQGQRKNGLLARIGGR